MQSVTYESIYEGTHVSIPEPSICRSWCGRNPQSNLSFHHLDILEMQLPSIRLSLFRCRHHGCSFVQTTSANGGSEVRTCAAKNNRAQSSPRDLHGRGLCSAVGVFVFR